MGDSSSLPAWLNLIWMSLSFLTLMGAAIWTFCFFYPYLKQMRMMQFEALKLGRESTKVLEGLNNEIKPTIEKINRSLDRAESLVEEFEEKDIFNRVESHLESIRSNIEEKSKPLPLVRRPSPVHNNGGK